MGVVAAGPVEADARPGDPFLAPGDRVGTSTTAVTDVAPTDVAVTAAPTTTAPGTPTAASAPTSIPPPVPLPADPDAVVLRVSRHGGYPIPGAEQRSRPVELHAGGRLVRPVTVVPPDGAGSAHHRLHTFRVTVAEVQALVALAEAGGVTDPPADLGHDPRLADWGVQVFEVDRPGLRARLVVRDLTPESTSAPNLSADQVARRRVLLDLATRIGSAGSFVEAVHAFVRAVAAPVRVAPGAPTTTIPGTTRTWPGPPLALASHQTRCIVLPFVEMERYIPGWSTASWHTRWRSGEQLLTVDFVDATTPGEGCAAPP